VVTADFNGDGKLDLALTSTPLAPAPGNLVSLLLGNGDGTFGAPVLFGTGSQAYSAAVGDFDGGGAADLAVANGVSNTVSVLLNTQGTLVATASSANPSLYGETVSFATTVAASVTGVNTPTGSVTLMNGSVTLGSGTLSNGTATVTTHALTTGADSLSVIYSGDSHFQPHTITFAQTVQPVGTSTALTSSANPSSDQQSVTFTATVTANTTATPVGSVTFLDGATTLGSSTLNSSGAATFTTSTLSMGTQSITASYGGNSNFTTSTSPAMNQIVGKANTTTSLSSSSTSGNLVLTATVASAASGTPTGTVTFMDGSTQLGNSPLGANGTATISTTNLSDGAQSITATYSGNSNFNASTSSADSVTAGFQLTASALSPGSVTPGQSATASITVAPSNGFNPSGVTFTCSVTPTQTPAPTCSVGTISVANDTGSATLTVSTTASTAAQASLAGRSGALLVFGLLIPAMLLSSVGKGAEHRRRLLSFLAIAFVAGCCLLQAACGGGGGSTQTGGSSGTPAGSYTVNVTGTANGVQHTATTNLTVQ
jgi:hypothetical protein